MHNKKDISEFDSQSSFNAEINNIEVVMYDRKCTMCGKDFTTKTKSKNVCSFICRRSHVRQHSLYYSRIKRKANVRKNACIICGFSETTDLHRERGMMFILCPNHHCLITRGLKTIEELLNQIKK